MRIRRALVVLSFVFLFLAIWGDPAPACAQVSGYAISSVGLDDPGLDGGDTELEFADVNGDGRLDLISVGDHGNPLINSAQEGVLVWFGDGRGNWSHGQSGDRFGYGGIAVGDVNGDGLLDVAYGIHHDYASTDLGDQLLEVALGDGSGLVWTPWDDGLADEGQDWGLFATDLADVDGDGDLDVGSTSFGSGDGFHVYLNDGDGSWRRSFGYLGGNSAHVFAFGDVNGDGLVDVVTAKQEGAVWLGDGEGFFEVSEDGLPAIGPYAWREGPSLGDVNADGLDDLAYCDDAGNARVYLRVGDAWQETAAEPPDSGQCSYTALADMDGDGTIDLATFGEQWVHVIQGNGAGTSWSTMASFETPAAPGRAHAFRVGGDFDRNGRPDLALVAEKKTGLFSSINELFAYRETTPAAELRVRVVAPGPQRRLVRGTAGWIRWLTESPGFEEGLATVELSCEGGPWRTVAEDLPDAGSLQWRVPGPPAGACRVRITATTGSGSTSALSAPFEIVRRPDALELSFADGDTLSWVDGLSRDRFALYRGSLEALRATGLYTQDPATEPGAARWCELAETTQADAHAPAPGSAVYYLVAGRRLMEDGQEPGVAVLMAEGSLGEASAGAPRRHGARCPD